MDWVKAAQVQGSHDRCADIVLNLFSPPCVTGLDLSLESLNLRSLSSIRLVSRSVKNCLFFMSCRPKFFRCVHTCITLLSFYLFQRLCVISVCYERRLWQTCKEPSDLACRPMSVTSHSAHFNHFFIVGLYINAMVISLTTRVELCPSLMCSFKYYLNSSSPLLLTELTSIVRGWDSFRNAVAVTPII